MNFNIKTSTKHIDSGDVFFCFLEAEKYLTDDILKKVSKVFCEIKFFERNNDLLSFLSKYKDKIVEINDLKKELIRQLQNRYKIPKTLIAITGTKGKTSSAWFTMQLIGLNGKKCGYIGTLGVYSFDGSIIEKINKEDTLTTPSIDDMYYFLDQFSSKNIDIVVFEASSHAIQQGRIEGLNIKYSIFTNLSQDHLDYHKTMDNYFYAKSLLFSKYQNKNGICVINGDDDRYSELKDICVDNELNVYSVGKKNYCDIIINYINQKQNGQEVSIEYNKKIYQFTTDILGEFQIYNISEILLICKEILKIDLEELCKKVKKISSPIGRMQNVCNTNIFIDFAHTPKSLEESIKLLKNRYNKVITIFGCGGNRDKQKRPIMCEIALKLSSFVIITTDNPRFENPEDIIKDIVCFEKNDKNNSLFLDEFVNNEIRKINKIYKNNNCDFIVIQDRKEAIKYAVENYKNKKDTSIIIAGKGHENYQIIGNTKYHFDDFEEVKNNLK